MMSHHWWVIHVFSWKRQFRRLQWRKSWSKSINYPIRWTKSCLQLNSLLCSGQLLASVSFLSKNIISKVGFTQYSLRQWMLDCSRKQFPKMTVYFCRKSRSICPIFENFPEWLGQTGTRHETPPIVDIQYCQSNQQTPRYNILDQG